jgi:clan AA aspartic protease
MISGTVNSLFEMVIQLPVRDPTGTIHEIEVLIDTGFTGSLSLPRSVVASLGLPWRTRGHAILADGRMEEFDVHAATVIWDGAIRSVLVQAIDNDPLLGMGLLVGHDLWARVTFGGSVRIQAIP